MTATPLTARQEWQRYGPLAFAGMLGMSFSTLASTSLGVFMTPLQHEFGWNRAQISAALTISAVVSVPLSPLSGALADRFGARRIAIPGVVLAMTALAAVSLVNSSIYSWLVAWFVLSLVTLLTKTPVWASAVSGAFSTSRGLAIAIVLSGLGLAQIISPMLARLLIDNYGWRGAYIGLACGWGSVTLLMVSLFFYDMFGRRAKAPPGSQDRVLPGGLTLRQALRDSSMQRITFAISVQAVIGAAALSHLVPILEWSHMSRAGAAGIASLYGIATISGKLVIGWLADLVRRSLLPAACFALPGFGYVLLMQGAGSATLLSGGVFLIGLGSGSAYHMSTFLTAQYGGMRHNGKIFGLMAGILGLAGGIGPLVAGLIFDWTGSYYTLLLAGLPLSFIAGASVLTLGPYPVFVSDTADEAAKERPAGTV